MACAVQVGADQRAPRRDQRPVVHLAMHAQRHVRTVYTPDEIDAIGIYCDELDRCFLVPISAVPSQRTLGLRLTPARNGQQACITLADDFDFEGAIAQLGERCHGMAEVVGSSPTSSTSPDEPTAIGSNPFRDKLGYWLERVAAGEQVIVTHRGRPRVRLSPASVPRPTLPAFSGVAGDNYSKSIDLLDLHPSRC
jgi:prevent-host-death family protein